MSIDMKFSNYFETRLNAELNVSATSIVVQSVANMPTIIGDEYFYLTIHNTTTREIVKVTNVDIPSLTLTIERAKDGTTAITWPSGSKIAYFISRIMMDEVLAAVAEVPEVPDAVEELLHTEEITSSVANVEFSIPNSANYRRLRIEWDLEHVAGGSYCDLFMELKLGGSFKTSGYKASAQAFNSNTNSGQNTTANIQLSSTIASADTEQSGHVIINNEDGVQRKGYGQFCGADGNGWVGGVSAFAYTGADETEVVSDVKMSMTTNMTGGKFRAYGVTD